MKHHLTDERLNDFLDGLLPDREAVSVRTHLEECQDCRRARDELASLLADLRVLPDLATTPQDLWPAIEDRLARGAGDEPGGEATVLQFPSGMPARRRPTVSLPRAAAAAIALSALSGGTVWWAMSRAPVGPPQQASKVVDTPFAGTTALLAASGAAGYEQAVARLADVIDRGRGLLAPETLETLDASLETIERALDDVRVALAADPSSEILARMLVSHQGAKLRLLSRAALSIQAAS